MKKVIQHTILKGSKTKIKNEKRHKMNFTNI